MLLIGRGWQPGVEAPTNRLLFENPGPVILSRPSERSQTQLKLSSPSSAEATLRHAITQLPNHQFTHSHTPADQPLVSAAGKQSRRPQIACNSSYFHAFSQQRAARKETGGGGGGGSAAGCHQDVTCASCAVKKKYPRQVWVCWLFSL